MKALTGSLMTLAIALAGTTAEAAMKVNAASGSVAFLGGGSDTPDLPPPKKLREAKFRARVKKSTFEPKPDGSFEYKVDDVCITSGTLNVYEVNDGTVVNFPDSEWKRAQCASTLKGQPVNVYIGGLMGEGEGEFIDWRAPIKFVLPSLMHDGAEFDESSFLWYMTASRDPRTTSFLSYLYPTTSVSCGDSDSSPSSFVAKNHGGSSDDGLKCAPNLREFFTAEIEIEDK